MNPLFIPIGLLLLGLNAKRNMAPPMAAPARGPAPTPPPGASTKRSLKTQVADERVKRFAKAAPAPSVQIEHPDVIPAHQDAAAQAAVDAAVTQAIRDDTKPAPAPARSPKQAAGDLQHFLIKTGRFGTLKDRPAEVIQAQRDLGVKADGIVGPKTRAAARKQGVALPPVK